MVLPQVLDGHLDAMFQVEVMHVVVPLDAVFLDLLLLALLLLSLKERGDQLRLEPRPLALVATGFELLMKFFEGLLKILHLFDMLRNQNPLLADGLEPLLQVFF